MRQSAAIFLCAHVATRLPAMSGWREGRGPVRHWPLLLVSLLGGCAVQVYHPTRTRPEQERDIRICDDQGYYSAPHDPLLAYQLAYDCLEAKGYTRRGSRPAGANP